MKIGLKISLVFFLATLLIAVIATPIFYMVAKDALEKSIFSHLESVSDARTDHLETFLRLNKSLILQLSKSIVIEDFLKTDIKSPDYAKAFDKISERLERTKDASKFAHEVFVLDSKGKIVTSSYKDRIGLDRSGDTYFYKAKLMSFIKDAYFSETSKEETLSFSSPIKDGQTGEFLGVVASKVTMDGVNEITTDRTGLGDTGDIYIVNKDGYMITPSRFFENGFLKLKISTEGARKCFEDVKKFGAKVHEHSPSIYEDYRGIMVLGTHDHLGEMNWCLIAEIDKLEAFEPLNKLRYLFIGTIFFISLLAWLIGIFVSKIIRVPILKLRKGAEIIGNGNLDYKIDMKTGDEIGYLSQAFNHMTENLKSTTTSINKLNKEIKERKEAEETLRMNENKYRTLLENLPQKIFLKNENLVYISCNNNFAVDLGIKSGEISGKTDYDLYPKESAEKYREDDKRIAKSGKAEAFDEKYVQKGKKLIVHTIKTLIKDKEGNVIGILGIFWDVTQLRKAEEKIKQAAEEWERTFNAISDLIFIQDVDHTIFKVNKAFADVLKMRPDEIIGKKCYELLHKSNKPWPNCPFEKTKQDGKSHTQEVDDLNIGMPLLVTTSPLFDNEGKLWGSVHFAKDITKLKEAEKKVKESVKIKSDFTSMVSHELRTPLTAIKEGISIVADETAGKISKEQREFLDIAKRNVDRLARLINDVLDFQKLEAGRVEFSMKENDISEVIEEVRETMNPLTREKGINLIAKPGEKLPRIGFDRDRIIQVLTNLINNAVKFTEKGAITVDAYKEGNVIHVSVKDTGLGIRKEDVPKVFHKFEQLAKNGDRKTGGTGLGLAISREIIIRHNGKIWVESEFGKGATFHFLLPITERRV